MKYEIALEAARILYKIESLDNLKDELEQIRLKLEDTDEEKIILAAIEKIDNKQGELREKIKEL